MKNKDIRHLTMLAVATAFALKLRVQVDDEAWQKIAHENTDPDCCVSHEFCDPNVCMMQAYEAVTGEMFDPWDNDKLDVIYTAWAVCKRAKFFSKEV